MLKAVISRINIEVLLRKLLDLPDLFLKAQIRQTNPFRHVKSLNLKVFQN